MVMMAFLPSVCYGNFWNLPSNIKVDINFYNDSRCSDNMLNFTEFIFYCDHSTDQCCDTTLTKLAPFSDPLFNVCYDIRTNDNSTYIMYDCEQASINDVTSVEIFGFIGIVLICIITMMLFYLVCTRVFCRRNRSNDYDAI